MKREISPAAVVVAIVAIAAIAALFLFRAATDKPAYPGAMAGKPGQGPMTGPPPGMNIPGRTPTAEAPLSK